MEEKKDGNYYKIIMTLSKCNPFTVDVNMRFPSEDYALDAMIDIEDKYGYCPKEIHRFENGKLVEVIK